MGSCQAASVSELWTKIGTMLESESRRLKMPVHGEDASAKLRFMIEDLAASKPDGKMVLLVDEYDKPLLAHLGKSDVNDIRDALSCFFANIPANITVKREKYYQTLFYAVFVLIGARTFAECWTNRGRVDAVVETPCGIYVFEFKLNRTAEEALAQIKEKGYHEKYVRNGKKMTLIGVAFDSELRNLSDRHK